MVKALQQRADDLGESLLICELELYRARNLADRMQAFYAFCNLVIQMEILRREAEAALNSDKLVVRLDKKARSIAGSEPYKLAEWFATKSAPVSWMICPATFAPSHEMQPC